MTTYHVAFGEEAVNTPASPPPGSGQIVAMASGRYLVTWTDRTGTDTMHNVFQIKARLFEANGTAVGSEFTVLDQAKSIASLGKVQVTGLPQGGYLVTRADDNAHAILARAFTETGTATTAEMTIGTAANQANTTYTLSQPSITVSASGEYLASWLETATRGSSSTTGYHARFDANWQRIGSPVALLPASTTITASDADVTVALGGGGFVEVWGDNGQLFGRVYREDASAVSAAFRIDNPANFSPLGPQVAALDHGGFVVLWYTSSRSDGVLAQVYSATGTPIGARLVVDQNGAEQINCIDLTALREGGFAVTWAARSGDGDGSAIKVQRFDDAGHAVSAAEVVNTIAAGLQLAPTIAALANGSYAIAWTTPVANNNFYGGDIHLAGFAPDPGGATTFNGTPGADTLNGTAGDDIINGLAGTDQLYGLGGNDILDGGTGIDRLYGGDGDDRLIGSGDGDTLDGGSGIDTVDYSGAASGVGVSLAYDAAAGQSSGRGPGGDQLFSIEAVIGSAYNDLVVDADAIGRVVLGAGDDLYRVTGSTLRNLSADGGGGTDTLAIDNTHFNIAGSNVTGFEKLQLNVGGNFQFFSGFQQIVLAAAAPAPTTPLPPGSAAPTLLFNFVGSFNPGADVAIGAGQELRLQNSTLHGVLASGGDDVLRLGSEANVLTPIALGGGDDLFTIDLLYPGTKPGFVGVSGGAGNDRADILVGDGQTLAFDLANVTGFETLGINSGYVKAATVQLSHLVDVTAVVIGERTALTLAQSTLPGTLLQGAFGGSINLASGTVVGRYGFPDTGPYDRSTDLDRRDASLSTTITNRGTITGGVNFYIGDDVYDGRAGSVGGVVHGNGGNDTLLGGAGNDRLAGDSGDDLLVVGGGRDLIEGGAGTDTLVLAGGRGSYATFLLNGQIYLLGATEGAKPMGVEQVSFGGQTVGFDAVAAGARAFDALGYIASYGDLRGAYGLNAAAAEAHFERIGFGEGRSVTFNALSYIASYGDLRNAFGVDTVAATQHFIQTGAREGRGVTFDALSYIASYADLRGAFGINADAGASHYIRFGASENRAITFDGARYLASYADLRAAFGSDVTAATQHYIRFGAAEGRTATFDPLLYGASNTDLARTIGDDPRALTAHYLGTGAAQGRATSGFDPVGYLLANADLAAARLGADGALHHWLRFGAREGRDGDAAFGREQSGHTLGASTAGQFDFGGDRDWFIFTAAKGQHVDVAFHSALDGVLELHRADGSLVATSTSGPQAHDQLLSFTADTAGGYYLVVAGTAPGSTGSYAVDFHLI